MSFLDAENTQGNVLCSSTAASLTPGTLARLQSTMSAPDRVTMGLAKHGQACDGAQNTLQLIVILEQSYTAMHPIDEYKACIA